MDKKPEEEVYPLTDENPGVQLYNMLEQADIEGFFSVLDQLQETRSEVVNSMTQKEKEDFEVGRMAASRYYQMFMKKWRKKITNK